MSATTTTSGAATIYRELTRLNTLWQLDCGIVNHTGAFAAVNLAGPKSREVLRSLTGLARSASGAEFSFALILNHAASGAAATALREAVLDEILRW